MDETIKIFITNFYAAAEKGFEIDRGLKD